MKKSLLILTLSWGILSTAQVGINTNTPIATLDVISKGTDATTKALRISNSASPSVEMVTVLNNNNVGIGTTTPSTKLHINNSTSPAIRIVDGTQVSGTVLTSDDNGNGSWKTPRIQVILGTMAASSVTITPGANANSASLYTGATIKLPPGKWAVKMGSNTKTSTGSVITTDGQIFSHTYLATSNTSKTGGVIITSSGGGGFAAAGSINRGGMYGMMVGEILVNNDSGADQTYYLWVDAAAYGTISSVINVTGYYTGTTWENYLFATAIYN